MFRRWVSTVFWLRKSWAAISGFVAPVDDEERELELALRERVDAGPVRPSAARAPVGAMPELPELALGLEPEADGARGVERRDRLLELRHRAVALACLSQGAAGHASGRRAASTRRACLVERRNR